MLTRQRSECLFLQRLPPCKTGLSVSAWKVFFCLMFFSLRNSICKVSRLHPFVLLIGEIYRWREFRTLVEWILTGETPNTLRQTRLSVKLFNTSLTRTDVGSNPNLRSDRLRKGTASVAASSSYTNLMSATQNGRKAMKQVNSSASTLGPPTSDLRPPTSNLRPVTKMCSRTLVLWGNTVQSDQWSPGSGVWHYFLLRTCMCLQYTTF
jgi:hypothetical protein